jgi:hypothetical protein
MKGAGRGSKTQVRKTAKKPSKRRAASKVRSSGKSSRKAAKGAKSAVKKRSSASTRKKLVLVKGRSARLEGPVVRIAVKALDPLRKCGPNTTVELLYRVDETIDGRSTPHLVFFDRHGWYCEHGRTCPAVGHARKYDGQIARVS